MEEIDGYRSRVEASRRALAALPDTGWGHLGPPDERTGERWDRGHVLGHVAEMVPYWTGQIRAVLGGAAVIGRDETGLAERRRGIDGGREEGEAALLRRIDAGLAGLFALLDDLRQEDLDRRVVYRPAHEREREIDVRQSLEELLVGHVEAHLGQLQELT